MVYILDIKSESYSKREFCLHIPYILAYHATLRDPNWDLLQLEILGLPEGQGLALANYLHTKFQKVT